MNINEANRMFSLSITRSNYRINKQASHPIDQNVALHRDIDIAKAHNSKVLHVNHKVAKVNDEIARHIEIVCVSFEPSRWTQSHDFCVIVVSELEIIARKIVIV